MGELSRRRQARDLWVSRSHLKAGAVAGVFLLVASFAAGATTVSREVAVAATPKWMDQTASGELVELLARVDAAGESDGGLSRLTFPTALTEDEAIVVAPPYDERMKRTTHVAMPGGGAVGSQPLAEGWAVVIDDLSEAKAAEVADRILGAGLEDVRVEERLIAGQRDVRVGVGGLRSEAEAAALLLRIRQAPTEEVARARVIEIGSK